MVIAAENRCATQRRNQNQRQEPKSKARIKIKGKDQNQRQGPKSKFSVIREWSAPAGCARLEAARTYSRRR
jgi:hypothetical protein